MSCVGEKYQEPNESNQCRITPHTATGASPAKLLMGHTLHYTYWACCFPVYKLVWLPNNYNRRLNMTYIPRFDSFSLRWEQAKKCFR